MPQEVNTGHRFPIYAGAEAVEAEGCLAGFGDYHLIASQDVDIVRLEEVVAKDQPEELWPRDEWGKEVLHSVVAGTVTTPASNAGHGDTAGHGQKGQGDAAQLAYRSRRQT